MTSRRSFLHASAFTALSAASPRLLPAAVYHSFAGLPSEFTRLERENQGRLGVYVLDTGSGETAGYRETERFAMCSTFKSLLAAAVLQRVDTGKESLDRMLTLPKTFLGSSPITQEHPGGSMSIRDLGFAIITRSDNTAANLLLDSIGGPAGMTQFARSLGDTVTRLDRTETTLNEATPGDPRDTTSPAAMVSNWRKLLLENTLSPTSRKLLTEWLVGNKTGDDRLRKGLPATWKVGDKTGSNGETTTNDVAIVWPLADKPPLLIAAYLTECSGPDAKRNAVLAEVGRLVAQTRRT